MVFINWSLAIIIQFVVFISALSQAIEYREVRVGCIDLLEAEDTYVFNSQVDFNKELGRLKPPHPNCSEYSAPQIDFSIYTVIGFKIETGGCSDPDIQIDIMKPETRTILNVKVYPKGACRKMYQDMFWYRIPKTTKDLIDFQISTR